MNCPKPYCGGKLFYEPADDELLCYLCATRWERLGKDGWIEMGRPAPPIDELIELNNSDEG